jgi:NADPH:quinone reductase-like Zn-dependent oxidoreductase
MLELNSDSHSDTPEMPPTHLGIGLAEEGGELTTLELPTLAPDPYKKEILVQVLFVGMTPLSLWVTDFDLQPDRYPHVLGGNVVGRVIRTAMDVHRVQPGDMVHVVFGATTRLIGLFTRLHI